MKKNNELLIILYFVIVLIPTVWFAVSKDIEAKNLKTENETLRIERKALMSVLESDLELEATKKAYWEWRQSQVRK